MVKTKFNIGDTFAVTSSSRCPICGSDEVESNEFGYEYDSIYSEEFCLNCHTAYTMWFKPSHVVIQEIGIDEIGMYCGQDDDYCACSQSKTGKYVKTLNECTVEELIAEIVRRTNG